MATELLEPSVSDGVRLTHFFNGRVLTAEDLRREQDAAAERHRGLAGAVGEGVASGLEVTPATRTLPTPTVRITAGLAFNRDGDPVELPRDIELRLIPAEAEADEEAGRFALCTPSATAAEITNPGFYLLLARPASAYSSEQVAAVDLGSEGLGTRCGSRYEELGASFSLLSLSLPSSATADQPLAQTLTSLSADVTTDIDRVRAGDTSDSGLTLRLAKNLSKLRNGMAYWCAGYDSPGQRIAALTVPVPGTPAFPLSPLDVLRDGAVLPSCDVPLALLFVSKRQLEWVDMWSVRRAPVPRIGPDPLALVHEERPRADATAMVLQFRDHAASFLASDTPAAADTVAAPDWFLFLPTVGILPIKTGSFAGFNPAVFFSWQGEYYSYVPKKYAEMLLRRSVEEVPVDLQGSYPDPWPTLYRFRTDTGESVDWQNRYVMFSSAGYGYYYGGER